MYCSCTVAHRANRGVKVRVSEMEQRKNLCESLGGGPDVARFNTPLHHLSHPTLQENVDTSARLPALCSNRPFRHPAFTFQLPAARAAPTKCRRDLQQGHSK